MLGTLNNYNVLCLTLIVKIFGSDGTYIGDSLLQARNINYVAIKAEEDSSFAITLENITFKWISTQYQPDGVLLLFNGNAHNIINNCYFTNITTDLGHSSIIHLKKGNATLTNCTNSEIYFSLVF